jgi:hypothetical protein
MKNYTFELNYDQHPENPISEEFDCPIKLILQHRRYNLGHKHSVKFSEFDNANELLEYLKTEYSYKYWFPVYMYEHSGISLSISSFSCRFDSGIIGFAATNERTTENEAIELIKRELTMYNAYLNGDIWEYSIYEQTICECCGNVKKTGIDSFSGFYSETEAENEAKKHIEYLNTITLHHEKI